MCDEILLVVVHHKVESLGHVLLDLLLIPDTSLICATLATVPEINLGGTRSQDQSWNQRGCDPTVASALNNGKPTSSNRAVGCFGFARSQSCVLFLAGFLRIALPSPLGIFSVPLVVRFLPWGIACGSTRSPGPPQSRRLSARLP